MKSQKEETPVSEDKFWTTIENEKALQAKLKEVNHTIIDGRSDYALAWRQCWEWCRNTFKIPSYITPSRETPEKPDFEKMANDYFDEINILEWPGKRDCYKAGAERIWRDYVVASKEVASMESNNQTPKFNVYDLGSVAKNLNRGITNKNGSVIKSSDPYNAGSVVRTKVNHKKGK